MYSEPNIAYSQIKVRYKEILQQAEERRLAEAFKRNRPGLFARITSRLGEAMIALGGKFKMRRSLDAEMTVSNE